MCVNLSGKPKQNEEYGKSYCSKPQKLVQGYSFWFLGRAMRGDLKLSEI